jgi:hypothetical protein
VNAKGLEAVWKQFTQFCEWFMSRGGYSKSMMVAWSGSSSVLKSYSLLLKTDTSISFIVCWSHNPPLVKS